MDVLIGFVLMAVMLINPHNRVKACTAIFVVFCTHTSIANSFYIDEYFYYFSAFIADVVLVFILALLFNAERPKYIQDVMWILFSVCVLNILGGVLYYYGDSGYIYAGAMFLLNCALIIRLLIMTGRDKDGASSITDSYRHNAEDIFIYKELES